jgi:hypothetical protein
VGIGKSTLIVQLAREAGVTVFPEWLQEMPADLMQAPDSLAADRQEAVQDWIFQQVALKNAHLLAAAKQAVSGKGGGTPVPSPLVHIADRSPLDTFAFYPPKQWPRRAQQLTAALKAQLPQQELAPGVFLMLTGDVDAIYTHMDPVRGYDCDTLQQQQAGFLALRAELIAQGAVVPLINVSAWNPGLLAKEVYALMTTEPYRPFAPQTFLTGLSPAPDWQTGGVYAR